MLGFAWLTLRQAREALQNGRLEEAHRLLCQDGAMAYRGAGALLQAVGRGFVERARRKHTQGNPVAAWDDLLHAEHIGITDADAAELRQDLTRTGLTQARALLDAGEADRASDVLAQLRDRGVQSPEVQLLEEAARNWARARDLAARGEFGAARQALDRVGRVMSERPASLARFEAEVRERSRGFGDLVAQLHDALRQADGRRVLLVAEQILTAAPQHEEARRARGRAWRAVEPATLASPGPHSISTPPEAAARRSPRFLLWVDGVGGYLICLGDRVTLGQAAVDSAVDVPLYADISRAHASLNRDAEGYLLEATRPVQVNGRAVERALLRSGDRITLGNACELRFSQPVPVSATAQLEVISGHRLSVAVDRIFLMADTLVLGPALQSHVSMPDLAQPVILYRHKDGLAVRHAGTLTVDGQPCRDRGILAASSQVSGEDFSFAVEPLGARTGQS